MVGNGPPGMGGSHSHGHGPGPRLMMPSGGSGSGGPPPLTSLSLPPPPQHGSQRSMQPGIPVPPPSHPGHPAPHPGVLSGMTSLGHPHGHPHHPVGSLQHPNMTPPRGPPPGMVNSFRFDSGETGTGTRQHLNVFLSLKLEIADPCTTSTPPSGPGPPDPTACTCGMGSATGSACQSGLLPSTSGSAPTRIPSSDGSAAAVHDGISRHATAGPTATTSAVWAECAAGHQRGGIRGGDGAQSDRLLFRHRQGRQRRRHR